jgi:hypothetical protein
MKWTDNFIEARKRGNAFRNAVKEGSSLLSDETAKELPFYSFKQWSGAGVNYIKGEVVTDNDVTYRVLQAHKSQPDWRPDISVSLFSSFSTVSDPGGEQVEVWKQPTGGHNAYNIGDKVMYEGKIYESLINGNTWSPTAYPAGWKLIN